MKMLVIQRSPTETHSGIVEGVWKISQAGGLFHLKESMNSSEIWARTGRSSQSCPLFPIISPSRKLAPLPISTLLVSMILDRVEFYDSLCYGDLILRIFFSFSTRSEVTRKNHVVILIQSRMKYLGEILHVFKIPSISDRILVQVKVIGYPSPFISHSQDLLRTVKPEDHIEKIDFLFESSIITSYSKVSHPNAKKNEIVVISPIFYSMRMFQLV